MGREYRRLLLTTPSLARWVAGIILSEETLGQDLPDGTPFGEVATALGIVAGIKVDKGVTPLPFSDGGLVTGGWIASATGLMPTGNAVPPSPSGARCSARKPRIGVCCTRMRTQPASDDSLVNTRSLFRVQ